MTPPPPPLMSIRLPTTTFQRNLQRPHFYRPPDASNRHCTPTFPSYWSPFKNDSFNPHHLAPPKNHSTDNLNIEHASPLPTHDKPNNTSYNLYKDHISSTITKILDLSDNINTPSNQNKRMKLLSTHESNEDINERKSTVNTTTMDKLNFIYLPTNGPHTFNFQLTNSPKSKQTSTLTSNETHTSSYHENQDPLSSKSDSSTQTPSPILKDQPAQCTLTDYRDKQVQCNILEPLFEEYLSTNFDSSDSSKKPPPSSPKPQRRFKPKIRFLNDSVHDSEDSLSSKLNDHQQTSLINNMSQLSLHQKDSLHYPTNSPYPPSTTTLESDLMNSNATLTQPPQIMIASDDDRVNIDESLAILSDQPTQLSQIQPAKQNIIPAAPTNHTITLAPGLGSPNADSSPLSNSSNGKSPSGDKSSPRESESTDSPTIPRYPNILRASVKKRNKTLGIPKKQISVIKKKNTKHLKLEIPNPTPQTQKDDIPDSYNKCLGAQISHLNKNIVTQIGLPTPSAPTVWICDSNGAYLAEHQVKPSNSHIFSIPGATTLHVIRALESNLKFLDEDKRKARYEVANVVFQVGILNFYYKNDNHSLRDARSLLFLLQSNFPNAAIFIHIPYQPQFVTINQDASLKRWKSALFNTIIPNQTTNPGLNPITIIPSRVTGGFIAQFDSSGRPLKLVPGKTFKPNFDPLRKRLNVHYDETRCVDFIENVYRSITKCAQEEKDLIEACQNSISKDL